MFVIGFGNSVVGVPRKRSAFVIRSAKFWVFNGKSRSLLWQQRLCCSCQRQQRRRKRFWTGRDKVCGVPKGAIVKTDRRVADLLCNKSRLCRHRLVLVRADVVADVDVLAVLNAKKRGLLASVVVSLVPSFRTLNVVVELKADCFWRRHLSKSVEGHRHSAAAHQLCW